MEVFQAVCGWETPSGGDTGILAFADHVHAQKPIPYYRRNKNMIGPLLHMLILNMLGKCSKGQMMK